MSKSAFISNTSQVAWATSQCDFGQMQKKSDSDLPKVWFTHPTQKHAHSSFGSWISSGSGLSWNVIKRQVERTPSINRGKQDASVEHFSPPHLIEENVNQHFQDRISMCSPVLLFLQAPQTFGWAYKSTVSPVLLPQFKISSAQLNNNQVSKDNEYV